MQTRTNLSICKDSPREAPDDAEWEVYNVHHEDMQKPEPFIGFTFWGWKMDHPHSLPPLRA
jgi:hypothetical protein